MVNHIDGDCYNNTVENLEWCTYSENTRHAYDNNLTSGQVRVIQVFPSGKEKVHDSIAKAARHIGASTSGMGYALQKGTIFKGYIWKRA